MSYGSKPFGETPFGGPLTTFNLLEASAINPQTLTLRFSENLDFNLPSVRDPSNYYVQGADGTTLSVTRVVPDPDPKSVRLITSGQNYVLYTVRANELVESAFGSTVNPLANTATCTGFPEVGRLRAQAVQQQAIVVIFNQKMLVNASLTATSSYSVLDPLGTSVVVTSVTTDFQADATRVYLQVATPLISGVVYSLTVASSIVTTLGLKVLPETSKVSWFNQKPRSTKITLSKFTGEVQAPPPNLNRSALETLRVEESLAVVLVPYRVGPSELGDVLRESLYLQESASIVSNRFSETLSSIALIDHLAISEFTSFRSDSRSTSEISLSEAISLGESLVLAPDLSSDPTTQTVDSGIAKLFGTPQGLVFFSPSLVPGGVSNSSIQVSDVSVCTQPFDTYRFPATKTYKNPFYLFGAAGINSILNNTPLFDGVQPWEVQLNLHGTHKEVVSPPVDVSAGVIQQQRFDPTWAALLNNPGWVLNKSQMPSLGSLLPADNHTTPAWIHFDATVPNTYPFITAKTSQARPPVTTAPKKYFVTPTESLALVEHLSVVHTSSVSVSDSVTQSTLFDLSPGETQVQLNVSETLAYSESTSFRVGLTNTEVVHVTESISVIG